jgi:cytoskeletal protein RodZ
MDAPALGHYLRETREAQEKTLDQVERDIRIRRRILEAFEMGDFNVPASWRWMRSA